MLDSAAHPPSENQASLKSLELGTPKLRNPKSLAAFENPSRVGVSSEDNA